MTDLSKVSRDLDSIQDMAARLSSRAVDLARNADGPGGRVLGGDAMVNMAASSNRFDWQRRIDLAEEPDEDGVSHTLNVEHEDPEKLWPPLTILRWYSDDYRQQLGMERDPAWQPTLVTEAGFLRNRDVAEWIWTNEPRWDTYAADVARAKAKLENILHEGKRAERSRVICGNDDCDDPKQLIRVYARRQPVEWTCADCTSSQDHPDVCDSCEGMSLVESGWSSNKDDDLWKCSTCKRKYDTTEVAACYAKQLRRVPERWMAISHAIQLMREQGWQERVVRTWLDDLETRTEDVSGRREVLWSGLWRRHLVETNVRQQRTNRTEQSA